MTAHAAIAGILRTGFDDLVANEGIEMQVIHDNVDQPASPPEGRWCRFIVQFGQRDFPDVSSSWRRTVGQVLVQLFEPKGVGDGELLEIVDLICANYDGVSLPGPPVIAFDPPYVSAPPTIDGAHWMTVVSIPFRSDSHE